MVLVAWVPFVLVLIWRRGMGGTSVLSFLSVASLAGAVISQLAGWPSVRGWFLLAWAGLLVPVAIGLFSHPMRAPAWGVFVGFWGVVGVLWLTGLARVRRMDEHNSRVDAQWYAEQETYEHGPSGQGSSGPKAPVQDG